MAIEEQLAEFAAEGKKIDEREIISNIITGAIMFGVTPRIPLTAISEAEAAGRIALRDVESSLVSNIVEDALMHKPFDFESVAEQALGVTVADIGTNIVKSEIQIAKANQQAQTSAQKSYTEAQQNSVNSKNPGKNMFGIFGGNSNSNMDTSENTQDQQNTTKDKPNWLTASASDLLGNSGDNSMQDMDFDISLPSASNSPSSTQNPFGFWTSPVASGSDDSLIDAAHIGLGSGAVGAGIGELSNVMNGMWKGSNGNWYSLNWTGNQWTGGRNTVVGIAEDFRFFGKNILVLDTGINLYQGIEAYNNGNRFESGKYGFDTFMAGVGFFGGLPGFIASTSYFVIDKFVGWNRMSNFTEQLYQVDQSEFEEQTANMGFSNKF